MRKSVGLTLMEMVATVTIIGVLSALAAPSLSALMLDSQRTAAVNDFLHALLLARSEAVTRGEVVSVCKAPDHQQCANRVPEWATGWIVFVNRDRDEPPQRDPQEALLAAYHGWRSGRITANRPAFSFRSHRQGVVNGTVVFCDRRGPEHARAIIVNHTGRPRVARRDAGNKALRCPPG